MEALLTKYEVADRLKVSKRTIDYWMKEEGMPYVKLGHRTVRFEWEKVEEWVRGRVQ